MRPNTLTPKFTLARMSTLGLMAAMLVAAPISGAANAQDMHPGKKLAITAFKSIDENERGFIDMADFHNFSENVFVSMDANDDGSIDLDEFLFWDYGMKPIAQARGASAALTTAMRVVHAFWDRNGDGKITHAEHRTSTLSDFRRADIDDNAILTQEEFVSGFTVMKALRAAIAPEIK